MTRTSREVRLVALPDGLPRPEHFAIVETPLPVPGPGQVLLRNRHFQVFPSLRTLIGGGVPGAPLPPLHPGDTLFGAAIGEVRPGPHHRAGPGDRPPGHPEEPPGGRDHPPKPGRLTISCRRGG
ncbi:hypothetical protein [Actinomadura sp. SCN-SB]|uniref:hypothetical protein n=1 Tax=Actinomadura sp. SCN-SB TaxID=3373092 RepID=UPI003750AC00